MLSAKSVIASQKLIKNKSLLRQLLMREKIKTLNLFDRFGGIQF